MTIRIEPNGVIGMHQNVKNQLFIALLGNG